MTVTLAAPQPPGLTLAGRNPETVVWRLVARLAVRSGALWGVAFGLFIVLQTSAYTSQHKTEAARVGLARAYGTNLGLNALLGQAKAINTVGGWAQWRFIGILTILGSVWGLLTATRLLRGEEETGRLDLLLAGQTTRGRAARQATAGLGAGLLAMFTAVTTGTIIAGWPASVGLDLGKCLALSAALVAGPAMFLAIGALTSQLASTRRRATAIAGGRVRHSVRATDGGRHQRQCPLAGLAQPARLDRAVPPAHQRRPLTTTTHACTHDDHHGRIALSGCVLVVAGIVGGIGAWAGAATQHAAISLGSLVAAGLNVVPPALLLFGLGALTHGLWPRKTTTVVYGYPAWSFLIEMAGWVITINRWMLDTSVFFHMTPAPAANPDWTSAAILTGLGAVGALLGGLVFHRRDLQNA